MMCGLYTKCGHNALTWAEDRLDSLENSFGVEDSNTRRNCKEILAFLWEETVTRRVKNLVFSPANLTYLLYKWS